MPIVAIIVIVIVIPIILFPVAFIWFINITGLWAVWKDSRAREKRRVKARKEALAKVIK
jgi:predicted membrane protein